MSHLGSNLYWPSQGHACVGCWVALLTLGERWLISADMWFDWQCAECFGLCCCNLQLLYFVIPISCLDLVFLRSASSPLQWITSRLWPSLVLYNCTLVLWLPSVSHIRRCSQLDHLLPSSASVHQGDLQVTSTKHRSGALLCGINSDSFLIIINILVWKLMLMVVEWPPTQILELQKRRKAMCFCFWCFS